MGLILKRLPIAGDRGKSEREVLFDNGASYSLIKGSIAKELATVIEMRVERRFKLGDGESILTTNKVVNIEIEIDGKVIDDQFYVLEKLGKEVILGASTMQKWDMLVEPKNERVVVRKDPKAIEFFLGLPE